MKLENDIIERIRADFTSDDATSAESLLRESGWTGQISRRIVFASRGSVQRMRDLIQLANDDESDIISVGEWDDESRHVRDFSVSFLILSPADYWIKDIASKVHERGYFLTHLTSQHSDFDEPIGAATFDNGVNAFTVKKDIRSWSLISKFTNLRAHGLDAPINDGVRFAIQVDTCLYDLQKDPSGNNQSI